MNAPNREKIMKALACHADTSKACAEECPYLKVSTDAVLCSEALARDALKLIESLQEDIEVWKKRYKVMVLECKSSDDPNKEPAIVKAYTTEEVEQGKAVAFPNA